MFNGLYTKDRDRKTIVEWDNLKPIEVGYEGYDNIRDESSK